MLMGILSSIIIFGSTEALLAHPYHIPEGYPGGANFTVTSQYKEYSKINPDITAAQIAAAVDPLDGCSCVVFRMDDLQDGFVEDAQLTIMQDFIDRDEFFSVGPIPIIYGPSSDVVSKTLAGYNAGLFEIFTHGWAHDDFTNKTLAEQTSNMTASQNALGAIFGSPPNAWVPPFNTINSDSLTAMDSNGLEIISAHIGTDTIGPNFVADGTSDFKDGLGIYHLPSATSFIEYDPTPMRVTASEILDNVDSDIALRGYSIVTLHPQEFVNDGDPNVINATLYADLTTVIDGVIANNYPIRTFEQVVAFNGTVSIDDVTQVEGDAGTSNFVFTVTRSNTSGSMSVDYSTADDTATSPSDYSFTSGTINFADAGSLTQIFAVSVKGDFTIESDETFNVNLSNCIGCTIIDSQGVGTITNDDTPNVSIDDVTQVEGDSGTSNFVFNVTRSSNAGAISVLYQTADDTAFSPSDYTSLSLDTLNFSDGGLFTKPITVSVNGDGDTESNETFNVNLSNCIGCTIIDSQGVGTITNDDTPNVSIDDVTQVEGDSGTSNFVFNVTRSSNAGAISVLYQTADDTAFSPSDFTSLPLTMLNFAPLGPLTQTVIVPVAGDVSLESDERFNVNLSNCVGCTITDNQGVGTIFDDDTAGLHIQTIGSLGIGSGDGQFWNPSYTAIDSANRIIVTDTLNHRIQIFDSDGIHVLSFGSFGSAVTEFNQPTGIAVDLTGRIIVADSFNSRIQIFDSAGNFIASFGSFGTTNGRLNFPSDVAIDSNNRIIVADSSNNRIQIFNSAGLYQSQFGVPGNGTGQFNIPQGVAVDSTDRVLVTDSGNQRVQIFDISGVYQSQFGSIGSLDGEFFSPTGIEVGSADRILVADTFNHRIQIFDSSGSHLQSFGIQGSGDGQFDNPTGVSVDLTNRIIVTEVGNAHRLQIFHGSPPPPLDDLDSDGISDTIDTENIISSSITLTPSHTVQNVTVTNGAVLTIPSGLSLTITPGSNLTVESGGGVLVELGGILQFNS